MNKHSKSYIFLNIILGILSLGLIHGVFYLSCLIIYGFNTSKWPYKNPISFVAKKINLGDKVLSTEESLEVESSVEVQAGQAENKFKPELAPEDKESVVLASKDTESEEPESEHREGHSPKPSKNSPRNEALPQGNFATLISTSKDNLFSKIQATSANKKSQSQEDDESQEILRTQTDLEKAELLKLQKALQEESDEAEQAYHQKLQDEFQEESENKFNYEPDPAPEPELAPEDEEPESEHREGHSPKPAKNSPRNDTQPDGNFPTLLRTSKNNFFSVNQSTSADKKFQSQEDDESQEILSSQTDLEKAELLKLQEVLQEEFDQEELAYLQKLHDEFQEESDEKEREYLLRLQEQFDEEELRSYVKFQEATNSQDQLKLSVEPAILEEKTPPIITITPLHILIDNNETAGALRYLSNMNDDDLNVRWEGNTPLLLALKKGNLDLARALLEHPKIDVTLEDDSGLTALHWAAILRADDIIVNLLNKGAKLYDKEDIDLSDEYYQIHPEALLQKTKAPHLLYQLNPAKAYFEQYLTDSYQFSEIQKAFNSVNIVERKKDDDTIRVEQDMEKFYGCKDPKFFTKDHVGIIKAKAYSDIAFYIGDICQNMGWLPNNHRPNTDDLFQEFSRYYKIFLDNRNSRSVNIGIRQCLAGEISTPPVIEYPQKRNNKKKTSPDISLKDVGDKLDFIHTSAKLFHSQWQKLKKKPNNSGNFEAIEKSLSESKSQILKREISSFYSLLVEYCRINKIEVLVICRGGAGHKEQQFPKFINDIKEKYVVLNIDPLFINNENRLAKGENRFYLGAIADIQFNGAIKTIFCDYTNPHTYREAVPFSSHQNFLYLQGFWHGLYPVVELKALFYKLPDTIKETIIKVAFHHDLYVKTKSYNMDYLKQQLKAKLEPGIWNKLDDYLSVAANIDDVKYNELSINKPSNSRSDDIFYIFKEENNKNTRLHDLIDVNATQDALLCIASVSVIDLNSRSWGNTPLLLALKKGNLVVARALLKNPHIDVTLKDDSGLTALHWAAMLRADDIILTLVNKGANLYDKIDQDEEEDYYEALPHALLKTNKSPRLLYKTNPPLYYFGEYYNDYCLIQDVSCNYATEREYTEYFQKRYATSRAIFFAEGHVGICKAKAYSDIVFHIGDICHNSGWITPEMYAEIAEVKELPSSSRVYANVFRICQEVFLENRNKLPVDPYVEQSLTQSKSLSFAC